MNTVQISVKQCADFVRSLSDDKLAEMFAGTSTISAPAKKGPGRPKGSSNGTKVVAKAAKTNGVAKKAKVSNGEKKPGRPKSKASDDVSEKVLQFVKEFGGPVAPTRFAQVTSSSFLPGSFATDGTPSATCRPD
jgi:hypothetical protein